MENKKDISIIVPAFNEAKRIGACLDALLGQDLTSATYEIITVDNNSTDGTFQVIKSYPVIPVMEKCRGRARARNAGIQAATGDLYVFIDADCVPRCDWLRTLVEHFRDPSIGCVAGEILPAATETELHRYLAKIGYFTQRMTLSHPFLPFAQTGNAAYRRSVIESVGMFDENLLSGQDADLSWRMQLETQKAIAFAESAVVYHPFPTSSRGFFKQRMRHAYGSVALYAKYRELMPTKGKKETYWEYRALAKRAVRTGLSRVFGGDREDVREQWFMLLAELSAKAGRILGSLERRLWYL